MHGAWAGALLHKSAEALLGIRKGPGARGSPEETGASRLTGCGRGFAAWHGWGLDYGRKLSCPDVGQDGNHWGQPLTLHTDSKAEGLGHGGSQGQRQGARPPVLFLPQRQTLKPDRSLQPQPQSV